MEDNKQSDFDPRDSLKLIHSMIENTKHSISDSSHYFLMWGWAVMIGCILQYVLLSIHYPQHYYAWFVTPVALVVHFIFLAKDNKKRKVKTFIGEANGTLWMAIGFSFAVMSVIFSKIGWQYCFPFYILFYGVGTFVSGSIIQFKPLQVGGIACFVLAIVATYMPYDVQILITAIAIFISYILPGHLLRKHYYKHKMQHA